MHFARLRRVGGSVMLAIPRAFLDQLDLGPQADVAISIDGDRLVIGHPERRPSYTLAALLAQCDSKAPFEEAGEDRTSESASGRELI